MRKKIKLQSIIYAAWRNDGVVFQSKTNLNDRYKINKKCLHINKKFIPRKTKQSHLLTPTQNPTRNNNFKQHQKFKKKKKSINNTQKSKEVRNKENKNRCAKMLHKCCNEHEDKKKKAHGTKVEIHDREEHYVNEKNN